MKKNTIMSCFRGYERSSVLSESLHVLSCLILMPQLLWRLCPFDIAVTENV